MTYTCRAIDNIYQATRNNAVNMRGSYHLKNWYMKILLVVSVITIMSQISTFIQGETHKIIILKYYLFEMLHSVSLWCSENY